tara:strand:- start:207 stop:1472 length:1266 start_codon:yes stop_codon:yes gene_type:complete
MTVYTVAEALRRLEDTADLPQELSDLKLTKRLWRRNDREYTILRYDKTALGRSRECIETTGLFRSVVLESGKIKCFAPPKSLDRSLFTELLSGGECYAEEFVEGTMINMFYDSSLPKDEILGHWEIATRSSVGGDTRFFSNSTNEGKTFREMFIEALTEISKEQGSPQEALKDLKQEYCYSFVLQHPENRIVTEFKTPGLYLAAVYSIDDPTRTITRIPTEEALSGSLATWAKTPTLHGQSLTMQDLDGLERIWASEDTDYGTLGIMLCDRATGLRSKIRNPEYEKVRQLRGNQPKLQYRFLSLRQGAAEDVKAYLQYYPEDTDAFSNYGKQVRAFVQNLHHQYMDCKVRRAKDIKLVPFEYRNHVYTLHGQYLNDLRPLRRAVTRRVVEEYVNSLPAARLMFSINYPLGGKHRAAEAPVI